jgi:hypothetical protein
MGRWAFTHRPSSPSPIPGSIAVPFACPSAYAGNGISFSIGVELEPLRQLDWRRDDEARALPLHQPFAR